MKKLFITTFCTLIIFALGYTTYAATIKNLINNPPKISPEEKMAHLKVLEYNRFIQNIPLWISKEDREDLISQIEPLISSSSLKIIETVPSINNTNPKILAMMKMQFLNMYFLSIINTETNTARGDFMKNKSDISTLTPIHDDLEKKIVRKIINATSTEFISDMRWAFMEKNIKGFKRPNADIGFVKKDFIKNTVASDLMKILSKEKEIIKEIIPTDIGTSTAEELILISTTTEMTIVETLISTSTETTTTIESTINTILEPISEITPIMTEDHTIDAPSHVEDIITNTENQ